ncbi:hypothetical protein N7507_006517 [Penicillium longicatenatum]|nr:hypothetical protein N7507_006517 [Penicillium longicatenatum]
MTRVFHKITKSRVKTQNKNKGGMESEEQTPEGGGVEVRGEMVKVDGAQRINPSVPDAQIYTTSKTISAVIYKDCTTNDLDPPLLHNAPQGALKVAE